ncbi:MAG: hypothetical protein Q7S36_02725 [Candidatus Liptonbacteria bacterium]|nr:hypothetical protein [Candidatus Liptonbacteria bacterium]
MGSQKYILPIVLVVVFIAIITFAFLFFDIGGEALRPGQPAPGENTLNPAAPEIKTPNISVYAWKTKTGGFFEVRWENLPDGATRLNVFRSKTGTNKWSLWKSIDIPAGSLLSGSIQLMLKSGETTDGYSFYVQAVSGNGTSTVTLWTSSSTVAGPPPPPPADNAPVNGNPPPGGDAPANTTSSGQNPPPPDTTGAPPTESTGTIYYYTPEGAISGTSSDFILDDFWVQHVNRSVEIGWQNISSNADKVIVSRAKTLGGTWKTIVNQVDPSTAYSIRLVDETLFTDYYYKMTVYDGGDVIANYGPIELPALAE